MPYRLTIDLMPGGNHDREPAIQERASLRAGLTLMDRTADSLHAPYELTLYFREDGKLNGKPIRRLTVWTDEP